jgi:hypothetical protein
MSMLRSNLAHGDDDHGGRSKKHHANPYENQVVHCRFPFSRPPSRANKNAFTAMTVAIKTALHG